MAPRDAVSMGFAPQRNSPFGNRSSCNGNWRVNTRETSSFVFRVEMLRFVRFEATRLHSFDYLSARNSEAPSDLPGEPARFITGGIFRGNLNSICMLMHHANRARWPQKHYTPATERAHFTTLLISIDTVYQEYSRRVAGG